MHTINSHFRINNVLFRVDSFEIRTHFAHTHIDCALYIKNRIGSIDHYALSDVKYEKCSINFQSNATKSNESPSGLLIEMKRLNVPCDSGGYIVLGEQRKMCGKLEDISPNDRVQYFASYTNASIYMERNPIFSLNYKLVDYCYNVTLTAHNSSVLLQPIDDLECYFKIHLPYGNRIELNIYQNVHKTGNIGLSDGLAYDATMKMALNHSLAAIDAENIDLTATQYIENVDFCTGIAIRIKETSNNDRWSHCIDPSDTVNKFAFKSTGNALLIYVTKLAYSQFDHSTGDAIDNQRNVEASSVYIEYHAVPIPEIVSQCAFGWIAVNQFCISAVEQALPWNLAENHCRSLGGHLASIKSEREQVLIDALLLNG